LNDSTRNGVSLFDAGSLEAEQRLARMAFALAGSAAAADHVPIAASVIWRTQ
jgi:hypothetical protein